LYYLVYRSSTVPCVGASGAISGLMGAYTVLYGRQRIKVFYSLGFFFDYTTVPAILLLPLWLGSEVGQLLLGSYSNIAYVAHIGGLLSGAALGYVLLRLTGTVDRKAFAEDPSSRIPALLEQALALVSRLDFPGARAVLANVLSIDPDNRPALKTLFAIDKQEPHGGQFHATAARLLDNLSRNHDPELLHEYYAEYLLLAGTPALSPDLLLTIAALFSEQGRHQDAERILAFLVRTQLGHPKLAPGLLRLGRSYLKGGMAEKGSRCLQVIDRKYPGSPEARTAAELLKSLA
jgi:tetratricopeptide (TPR) repeat protein